MSHFDSRTDVATPSIAPTPETSFITIDEAVAESGKSRSTIRRALKAGVIPHSRVGLGRGQVRIRTTDLAAFVTPRPALVEQALTVPDPTLARPRTDRTDKGFTLIELLVVVIIIGILAGVAIPVFLNQKARGYDASVKADLKHIAVAAEDYWTTHDTYPVDATGWTASTPPSATTRLRIFTATTVPAGWVAYARDTRGGRIWSASSFTGAVPTATALADLPEQAPNAGQDGAPANAGWATWATAGGASYGTGTVQRDVLAWWDPTLAVSQKVLTDRVSLGGWDGMTDGTGYETPWTTMNVTDLSVAGRAAMFTVGDPASSDYGMQLSSAPYGATVPADGLIVTGQTYTASVYLKAPAGTPLSVSFRVQNASTWAWTATAASQSVMATGSWQRARVTVTASSPWAGQAFAVVVRTLKGSSAVQGSNVYVTCPQIDRGAVATPPQAQVPTA